MPVNEENVQDKKYELSFDEKEVDGKLVRRIIALKAIPDYGVIKGQIGGYVSDYRNLSHLGNCWIGDDAIVMDDASVTMDAHVSGEAIVKMTSVIKGDARVEGQAFVDGTSVISKRAVISGKAQVRSSRVSTDCRITGSTFLYDSVVGGNTLIYGSPSITGSNISGEVEISQSARLTQCTLRGKRIEILGNARLTNVKVGSPKCQYIDIRDNVEIRDSEVRGKGVFISGDAVLKTGVVVEGETTHIGEYAEITGNIHLGKYVTVSEFAKLLNLDKKLWTFTNKQFDGDFALVECDA